MYLSNNSKSVPITPEILDQIARVSGAAVTADDITVFEAAVANTRPLNKRGSIFHEGRMSADTLRQMADAVNSGAQTVPLHNMHMQGDELPIGKVFSAEVVAGDDGSSELRAMFYLPKSENSLIEKINLGIIDEVSVGVMSKQMLCSKCGFDYMSADSTFDNFWSQTCANDHTIGVDGTHVQLNGLDRWMELSLVSLGAANKPKIVGRARQALSKETYDRIAADGRPPEAVVLFTAYADNKESLIMDAETKAKFDALGAELAEIKTLVATLAPKEPTAEELAAAAAAATAEAEAAALAAEAAKNSELDALKVELETAKAELAALKAETPAADLDPQPTGEAATLNLPIGGVSLSAVTDATTEARVNPARVAAFKTPKR